MTLAERFELSNGDTKGLWASVVLSDGTIFDGIVAGEVPHGIYLIIGGDPNRMSLFPWGGINRVVYKDPNA